MKVLRNPYLDFVELKTGSDAAEYSRRLHSHPELSIGLIDSGGTKVRVRESNFCLEPGDILFIPPEWVHLCEPEDDSVFRFKIVYIRSEWFRDAFRVDPETFKPFKKNLSDVNADRFTAFLQAFPQAGKLDIETELILILEDLLAGYMERPEERGTEKTENSLEDVKNHINTRYRDTISLDDLARVGNMNKYTLVRFFRKTCRLTPHAYLLNVRINRAKELILRNMMIAEIAAECGFSDQSHFVKIFKAYVGIAPSEYRKK